MRPENSDTIFAVILQVPARDRNLKGKAKTACLSRHARFALRLSARKSAIVLPQLLKDANGVPQPCGPNYWSLTHKSGYVGAVAAGCPIGIDLERIRPVHPGVYRKAADETEWRLSAENRLTLFFRYWTAKEAVLKAAGTGLAELDRCRVHAVADRRHLKIDYRNNLWIVEQVYFDGHIAAIVKAAERVQWTLVKEDGRQDRLESETQSQVSTEKEISAD